MKVLVTGADGFVGRWLVRSLAAQGHEPVAAVKREGLGRTDWAAVAGAAVAERALELTDAATVREAAAGPWDAVAHLAALASGRDALDDPWSAWTVNAAGSARLLGELGRRVRGGDADPLVLLVSTAEVYGAGQGRPLVATDPVAPRSPYAASKAGAELAARETAARTGLRVVIARPFPHTGPGQDARFVAPSFAQRLLVARRAGSRVVKVGNLEPVRDLLDVRDVAAAYVGLLARGVPGEIYNVASGRGLSLRELFAQLAAIVGVDPIAEVDPDFVRPADIGYLVGEPGKLRAATGWTPAHPLERTLRDLVDAQAH